MTQMNHFKALVSRNGNSRLKSKMELLKIYVTLVNFALNVISLDT